MVFEFKWFFVYCKYLPFHSIWKTKEWRWRFPPVIDRILISSKFSIWYMTCVHMWLSMCHGAWPAGDEIVRVILLYLTSGITNIWIGGWILRATFVKNAKGPR